MLQFHNKQCHRLQGNTAKQLALLGALGRQLTFVGELRRTVDKGEGRMDGGGSASDGRRRDGGVHTAHLESKGYVRSTLARGLYDNYKHFEFQNWIRSTLCLRLRL